MVYGFCFFLFFSPEVTLPKLVDPVILYSHVFFSFLFPKAPFVEVLNSFLRDNGLALCYFMVAVPVWIEVPYIITW